MTSVPTVQTVPSVLEALMRSDPGRPRLTWYGTAEVCPGERVELSARVLVNWVAKTANLLVEEFDAAPGVQVEVDLPAGHWKTLVVLLAVDACGAEAVPSGAGGDVLVTTSPERAGESPDSVLVAMPALARSFEQVSGVAAPSTTLDYAAVITGYDDVFVPVSPGTTVVASAAEAADATWAAQPRFLLTAALPACTSGLDPYLVLFLALALADGSLVVALDRTGPERSELFEQENASGP